VRRTERDSSLSHSLAQPRVLKYGSCQPYHFFGTVDSHRRARCDRALGRLREIVGVGSDQYRHACRASLNQILTAIGKQASSDEGNVAGAIIGCHFTHAVAEHDVAVGIEWRVGAAPDELQTPGCKKLCYRVEPLWVPRHNDQNRVPEGVLFQSVKQQVFLALASARGKQHRSTTKPVPELRCE